MRDEGPTLAGVSHEFVATTMEDTDACLVDSVPLQVVIRTIPFKLPNVFR